MTNAHGAARQPDPEVERQPLEEVRDEAERRHIVAILGLAHGNRADAARILGISRKTLWKKLKRLRVRPPDVTDR